jgi:hypothetical protein
MPFSRPWRSRPQPGQQARFVAGDNLAGYFEGFTHSHELGAGYVFKSGTVFHNYMSYLDGVRNERASGREQVLPFGHRVAYANGSTEELALLSKKHALALRVTSAQPARLAIQPLLQTQGAVSFTDGVVTVAPGKGAMQFMALAADRPFVLEDGLLLRAGAPAASFTVVVGLRRQRRGSGRPCPHAGSRRPDRRRAPRHPRGA